MTKATATNADDSGVAVRGSGLAGLVRMLTRMTLFAPAEQPQGVGGGPGKPARFWLPALQAAGIYSSRRLSIVTAALPSRRQSNVTKEERRDKPGVVVRLIPIRRSAEHQIGGTPQTHNRAW
jgi:hypothetical protein